MIKRHFWIPGILGGLIACAAPVNPPGQSSSSVSPTQSGLLPTVSPTPPTAGTPTPVPTVAPTSVPSASPSTSPSASSVVPVPSVTPTPTPVASVNLPSEFTNTLGMKFVLVKPGSYLMGSLDSESGRDTDETRHSVTITRPFYIQTTEVSQKIWQSVMGTNPAVFQTPPDINRPVEHISWFDTQTFMSKLRSRDKETGTYRLPTEAEWEYAARQGTEGLFVFGSNPAFLGTYAWFSGNNTPNGTKPIGQKLATVLGLFDIHGNVAEWVQDNYVSHTADAVTDPNVDLPSPFKVVRGGSWQDSATKCRLANREIQRPDYKGDNIGFRLVWVP